MRRLLLLRHAPTPATRAFAFPLDESLDARGREAAGRLTVPRGYELLCSPAVRCVQTAEAAGLQVGTVEARLRECDFGSWAGQTLEDVAVSDEAGVGAWMGDPDADPHGGESLAAFVARVAAWLDEQARLDGGAVAITHGGVVKAAIVHALAAPLSAFWRVDVAPLSVTELHAHDGRWTLTRANVPAAGRGGDVVAGGVDARAGGEEVAVGGGDVAAGSGDVRARGGDAVAGRDDAPGVEARS